jgi:hypothetical protein
MSAVAWQNAYVATAVLVGETLDHATRSLGESDRAAAATTVAELSHENRAARAKALASQLATIARALEDLELGNA